MAPQEDTVGPSAVLASADKKAEVEGFLNTTLPPVLDGLEKTLQADGFFYQSTPLMRAIKRQISSAVQNGFENHPQVMRFKNLQAKNRKNITRKIKQIFEELPARLDKLAAFAAAHQGKLPSWVADETTSAAEAALRQEVDSQISFLDENGVSLAHPSLQRWQALWQADVNKRRQEQWAAEKRARLLKAQVSQTKRVAVLNEAQDKKRKRELGLGDPRMQPRITPQDVEAKRAENRRLRTAVLAGIQKEQEELARAEELAIEQDRQWQAQGDAPSEEQLTSTAAQAATQAESLSFPPSVTEDFILKLLNFYDKINPFGGTDIQKPLPAPAE